MSSYLAEPFPRFIDRERVRTAMEIGSRDALDAIAIANHYDLNRVTVIEPNPAALELCRANIGDDSRIQLIPKAASDISGQVSFFPVVESYQSDGSRTDNIGASSMLKSSNLYGETYMQEEISVPAVRIDDLIQEHNMPVPDLVCMDVQGFELNVLRSFGSKLFSVSYIITEATIVNQYVGQAQLYHINDFLVHRGFKLAAVDMGSYWGFGNFLYFNFNIKVPVVGS